MPELWRVARVRSTPELVCRVPLPQSTIAQAHPTRPDPFSRPMSATSVDRRLPVTPHLALLLLAFVVGLSGALVTGVEAYSPRANYGAKWEPVDGILHLAGQSEEIAFARYVEVMGAPRLPRFFMAYTRANRTVEDQRSRVESYTRTLLRYPPEVGLQLGLAFSQNGVSHAAEVLAGTHDASLEVLAEGLAAMERPILVRIGYEANGFWNGYSSSNYGAAFRHIAAIIRARAGNVATVWCVHPISGIQTIMNFYPGDDHVDWWSIDLFEPWTLSSPNTFAYLARAEQHARPVLIGECTPREVGVHDPAAWSRWYEPFFQILRQYPGIKGFSYINRQWETFANYPGWGDSRLEANPSLARRYREEMDHPVFRHAKPEGSVRTRVLFPVADGWAGPSSGSGSDSRLIASGPSSSQSRTIFLKFDLSGLSDDLEADFWLVSSSSSNRLNLSIRATTTEDWTEAGLAQGQAPDLAQVLGTVESGGLNDQRWNSALVSDYLSARVRAGATTATLALQVEGSQATEVFLHSREAVAANPRLEMPQLLVRDTVPEGVGPSTYLAWLMRHWAVGAEFSSPSASLVPGGPPNLLAYIFDLSPWSENGSTVLQIRPRTNSAGGDALALLHPPLNRAATDYVARLERSSSLGSWETVQTLPGDAEDTNPQNGGAATEELPLPWPSGTPLFYRLAVEPRSPQD